MHFWVEGSGEGASVGRDSVVTDSEGRGVTSWRLGNKVQQYFALVEVEDGRRGVPPESRFRMRGIEFKAMAMNKRLMLVELLGGLAIFIFGMRCMSEGLQKMADRRLKAMLQMMTRNRLFSVGTGMLLTAMVQSSSAVTVMSVGFVNAGLMTLKQAIGVVFGANIGTTITAQIIAFRLEALAYPAIAIGLVTMALARRDSIKHLGHAILGFGLLFLGMTTMSGILKPIRHSPQFIAMFQLFDCTPEAGGGIPPVPALMCIAVGTITTCVVQSSSATVGLVLALASQGLISFHTAVPLVMGDNIGTTITAVLASLGANRNAKRTAVAHTLFNVFGAAYMYALLFVPLWKGQPVFLGLVDALTPGDVFAENPENLLRHVANAHSAFNLFNCLLFLPFVDTMARVCRAIIPVTDADRETVLSYLEPHLLATPSLALQQAVREVAYMVRRAHKSVRESCALFHGGSRDLEIKVAKRENVIDRLQAEITDYLVELSRGRLSPDEAELIPCLIHAVNDAERVGDHTMNLLELAALKRSNHREMHGPAEERMLEFQELLDRQFEGVYRIFGHSGGGELEAITAREEAITELLKAITDLHVEWLKEGDCEVQLGIIYLDALAQLERIGDHLLNIAERASGVMAVTGELVE